MIQIYGYLVADKFTQNLTSNPFVRLSQSVAISTDSFTTFSSSSESLVVCQGRQMYKPPQLLSPLTILNLRPLSAAIKLAVTAVLGAALEVVQRMMLRSSQGVDPVPPEVLVLEQVQLLIRPTPTKLPAQESRTLCSLATLLTVVISLWRPLLSLCA